MRKIDGVFLFCVLTCAVLFAAWSLTQAVAVLTGGQGSVSTNFGVAGQSRNVDMVKLKRLLERRELSDHEAEFYEPAGGEPPSGVYEHKGNELPDESDDDAHRR